MFFPLLIAEHSAVKPVILVPGTCGTMLEGTVTRKDFWYCPTFKQQTIYLSNKYLVPPLYNCMFTALRLEYDEANNYFKSVKGVSLNPIDWGGIKAFEFGDIIPKHPAYTYFGEMIKYLIQRGYVLKESLYGAPFDWRVGPNLPTSFWANLTTLVEIAYVKNSHKKVVLLGHSLGGYVIQRFLTKHTTPEWRARFIDCGILSGPSFGGAGLAYSSLLIGELPLLSSITSPHIAPAIRSLGALVGQLPNQAIFGEKIIAYDKQGKGLRAKDYPRALAEVKEIDQRLFQINAHETLEAPEAPDVPIAIIYNDAIDTVVGYNQQIGNYTFGGGDLVVNAEGPEYACKNWKKAKVSCVNIKKADLLYNHLGIMSMQDALEDTMKYIFDETWKK